MRYLSADEIIRMNARVLGHENGLRDRDLLESAVGRPQASAFLQDAFPTLVEKAAALLHSLVMNHAFVDGNKRTATAAVILFLRDNGLTENWKQEHALRFILEIADGKHDVPEIAKWLEANSEVTVKSDDE
jgi:death-on-curing protein